jgi:predicted unusual protein kinase regulating ubiquinone biosynthesis (AarF/ABC1/UbiB family)
MFDINATNIIASECKTMATLSDSLQKVEYNENHQTICEELNSKLKTIITSAKARNAPVEFEG